jgi:uncharacterized membrane protein YqjE
MIPDPENGQATGHGPGEMLADVLAGITRLVQGELALAQAEAAERLQSMRQAAVYAAIAVVLGITAINLLAAAAVAVAVALGLGPIWASALVGGVLFLLAIGFAQLVSRLLREAGRLPRRSSASIRRDAETIQTLMRRDART